MCKKVKSKVIEIDASLEPIDPSQGRVSDFFNLNDLITSRFIKWECSESYQFSLKSTQNSQYSINVYNGRYIENPNLEGLYLADPVIIDGASIADVNEIQITITSCSNCIEFTRAAEAINSIRNNAFLSSVTSKKTVESGDPHAQGSNFYVDDNGRKHFIVSYDARGRNKNKELKFGYLVIFSEPVCDKKEPTILTVECANGNYNHPGSFQIVGDLLFLPVEEYRNSDDRADGSEVHVYDLSPLANDKDPVEIAWCTLGNHRAGALAVTDKWLAINDQETLYWYEIKGFSESKELNLDFISEVEIKKTQGIGLIKCKAEDSSGNANTETLYLLGLVTESDTIDYIYSYRFDVEEGTDEKQLRKMSQRIHHVYTEPGNGGTSKDGIHLKYGGGVYLSSGDVITCIGTGREIQENNKFNFNLFRNVDQIEVNCALGKIEKSEPRASQNFSVLNFESEYCQIKVYNNNGEVVTPELFVRRDISGGKDKNVCKIADFPKTKTKLGLDVTPLYLAYDEKSAFDSQDDGFLRVVIEGIT